MSLKRIIAALFTALMLALGACGGVGDTVGTVDENAAVTIEDTNMSIGESEQSLTFNRNPTTDIPCCCNCDFILANCEENGWKPATLCNYCLAGNCSPPPCAGCQ